MRFYTALCRCEERECNGLLRPNVVFFGETLDSHILTKVEKEIETCDLCLVVSHFNFNMHVWYILYSSCVVLSCNTIFAKKLLDLCFSPCKLTTGGHCWLLFSYRWEHLLLFTQQPCLALVLHPEEFQWRSLIYIQHRNQNISCKSVK